MPSRTHLKMKLLFILIFKILIINLTTQAVNATENRLGAFSKVGIPPVGSQIVTVGFYPRSAYDLDMAASTLIFGCDGKVVLIQPRQWRLLML